MPVLGTRQQQQQQQPQRMLSASPSRQRSASAAPQQRQSIQDLLLEIQTTFSKFKTIFISIIVMIVIVICLIGVLSFVFSKKHIDESNPELIQLLKQGNRLVNKGRMFYPDAIAVFSKALKVTPGSPTALVGRGEVLFLTMKNREALVDLDEALAYDSNDIRALDLRSRVLDSLGRLEESLQDYTKLAYSVSYDRRSEARQKVISREGLIRKWSQVTTQLDHSSSERNLAKQRDLCRACVSLSRQLISVAGGGSKIELRMKSVRCAMLGHLHAAADNELKSIFKYQPNNREAIILQIQEFRARGEVEKAKDEIRRCLRIDPEYRPCMYLHKHIRLYSTYLEAVERKIRLLDWSNVLEDIEILIAMGTDEAPNIEQFWRWQCQASTHLLETEKGITACSNFITVQDFRDQDEQDSEDERTDQHLVDVYLWRAEMHLINDDLYSAGKDYRRAAAINPVSERVKLFQQRLEKINRRGSRKDYYEVLGVSKSAEVSEIKQAFRRKSREYHPDRIRSKKLSANARARFDSLYRECLEAKDVLMDKEKRWKYDREDPLSSWKNWWPFS